MRAVDRSFDSRIFEAMSDEVQMPKEDRLSIVRSHFNSRMAVLLVLYSIATLKMYSESMLGGVVFGSLAYSTLWSINENVSRILENIQEQF